MLKVEASSAVGGVDDATSPADVLYNHCSRKTEGTIFFQRDLANMQVAETMDELTTLLQELCDQHLMKLMMLDGEPCWKLRSRSDAHRYAWTNHRAQ